MYAVAISAFVAALALRVLTPSQMKPALVHIADSAPAWMKQSSPPAGSISDPLETSDSDLGVDSLSEADDEAESELERSETARDLSSRHVSTATVRDVSQ